MRAQEPLHAREQAAAPAAVRPAVAGLHALAGNAAVASVLRRPTPVQRLLLGANGQLDTTNPHHQALVLAELATLDERSLRAVRGLLLPSPHWLDQSYVEWIDLDLARAEGLGAVSDQAAAEDGIWTQAILFVDGVRLYTTPLARSGSGGHQDFSRAHVDVNAWGLAERNVSAHDSEVTTLGDSFDFLTANVARANRVRLLLTGNKGPCEGCKSRVFRWAEWVRQRLGAHVAVEVETSYTSSVEDTSRHGIATRYGYPLANRRTDPRGRAYWTEVSRPM